MKVFLVRQNIGGAWEEETLHSTQRALLLNKKPSVCHPSILRTARLTKRGISSSKSGK